MLQQFHADKPYGFSGLGARSANSDTVSTGNTAETMAGTTPPLVVPDGPEVYTGFSDKQSILRISVTTARFGAIGRNQAMLELPFAMLLAWVLKTRGRRFSIHAKVHDSAFRVLNRVFAHYGEREIRRLHLDLFGGCLNFRRMRGGSAWSLRSWGIAIDFDPAGNQVHWGRDQARFAQPDYAPFWRFLAPLLTVLGRAGCRWAMPAISTGCTCNPSGCSRGRRPEWP